MFTKTGITEGITLYTRTTEQFKTISFSVKFKTALTDEKAAARAVLANILEDSNELYTNNGELRRKLDDLYGTGLYTDVGKRGAMHFLTVNMECVNDEYLEEDAVLQEALELMHSLIFKPNFVDGKFSESIVKREQKAVLERIRSQFDNKTSYAQKRMLEQLYPNEAVSISANGSETAVEKVTEEMLQVAYRSMLIEDTIDLYVVGDIDEQQMIDKMRELFALKKRTSLPYDTFHAYGANVEKEPKNRKEQLDMKQGKLHLAYSTPIHFKHPDYVKMQVLNGVFGGFAHSKLFMNVREKESMAYYASSSYASHYGLMYVLAGIDAKLSEKAVSLIQEQLEAMKNGEISDLEMTQTKALLKNSIRSTFDSARGQIEVFDQYKELDETFTANTLIEQWEQVGKEELQEMAQLLRLEIIYLLYGEEEEADA